MTKKTQNTQNCEECPKSNKSVIFLCISDWELKYFWLWGVGDQKSQF